MKNKCVLISVNHYIPCCFSLCVHLVVLQALVGHQYGTASLPTQVEVSEFQLLLQSCQQVGVSTQELERAYLRDENAVPASYCLRSSLPHTCSPLVVTVNLDI